MRDGEGRDLEEDRLQTGPREERCRARRGCGRSPSAGCACSRAPRYVPRDLGPRHRHDLRLQREGLALGRALDPLARGLRLALGADRQHVGAERHGVRPGEGLRAAPEPRPDSRSVELGGVGGRCRRRLRAGRARRAAARRRPSKAIRAPFSAAAMSAAEPSLERRRRGSRSCPSRGSIRPAAPKPGGRCSPVHDRVDLVRAALVEPRRDADRAELVAPRAAAAQSEQERGGGAPRPAAPSRGRARRRPRPAPRTSARPRCCASRRSGCPRPAPCGRP